MLNKDNIVSNKNENKDMKGLSSSEHNNWPFRMLIIGPSGSIHKPKYEYSVNKREQAGIKNLADPNAFIEYSDDMNDVLDDLNNYNKNRDKKVLIVFDDMIADIGTKG